MAKPLQPRPSAKPVHSLRVADTGEKRKGSHANGQHHGEGSKQPPGELMRRRQTLSRLRDPGSHSHRDHRSEEEAPQPLGALACLFVEHARTVVLAMERGPHGGAVRDGVFPNPVVNGPIGGGPSTSAGQARYL